jgi:hypothetical protein
MSRFTRLMTSLGFPRVRVVCAIAVSIASLALLTTARAAEGGASYYFPGALGSFGVSLPPDPGFQLASQTLTYHGDLDRAVLSGQVDVGLKLNAVYNFFSLAYTLPDPILGARFQISAAIPIAYAELKAEVTGALGNTSRVSRSDFNVGDMVFYPATFYWNPGKNFYLKLGEMIVAPTGHYDVNQPVNVGRNYWGFDTQLGLTYFNPKIGTEISVLTGILFNTPNNATQYKTGNEFHLDFMLNQFLSPHFAVGFQGYYYQQVTGDSGLGTRLGEFRGQSVGVGPGVLWSPAATKGKLSIIAKWLFDVENTNRLRANYGQLTIAYKFGGPAATPQSAATTSTK